MAQPHDFHLKNQHFFKIAQLTDLHLTSFQTQGPEELTLQLIKKIAADEQPDLYICTGDLFCGPDGLNCLKVFCQFMDENKLPWTFVYGNSEREYGLHPRVVEPILHESQFCLFDRGPDEIKGKSNYLISVYDEGGHQRFLLWMLDNCEIKRVRDYHNAYLDYTQIDWFTEKKKQLWINSGSGSKSLFFLHNPLPEYKIGAESTLKEGNCNEQVHSPALNSGAFASMLEMGDVLGVFVGEDHTNDFCFDFHGIKLCYGRLSGYCDNRRGAYPEGDYARGARIIVLDCTGSGKMDTYIYLDHKSEYREEKSSE